jgi:hypothetical protein
MIEQFLGKATSIIVAGAQKQHGLHAGMVKWGAFHGLGPLEARVRPGGSKRYTSLPSAKADGFWSHCPCFAPRHCSVHLRLRSFRALKPKALCTWSGITSTVCNVMPRSSATIRNNALGLTSTEPGPEAGTCGHHATRYFSEKPPGVLGILSMPVKYPLRG